MTTMESFGKWIEWANQQTEIEYEGYVFSAPFLCMCCGVETSPAQWAWGRTCGRCDSGSCQQLEGRLIDYDHALPLWRTDDPDVVNPMRPYSEITSIRERRMRRYAEAVVGKAIAKP